MNERFTVKIARTFLEDKNCLFSRRQVESMRLLHAPNTEPITGPEFQEIALAAFTDVMSHSASHEAEINESQNN
jgi:hypothetical protein